MNKHTLGLIKNLLKHNNNNWLKLINKQTHNEDALEHNTNKQTLGLINNLLKHNTNNKIIKQNNT